MVHKIRIHMAPEGDANPSAPAHWAGRDPTPTTIQPLDNMEDFKACLEEISRHIPHEVQGSPEKPLNKFCANVFFVEEGPEERTFGIVDVDDEPVEGRTAKRLLALGVEHLVYETYSSDGIGLAPHKPPAIRYRCIVPFAKPSSLNAWRAWVYIHLGLWQDPVSFVPKQAWYAPLWSLEPAEVVHNPGVPAVLPQNATKYTADMFAEWRNCPKGERFAFISAKYNTLARAVEKLGFTTEQLQGVFANDLTELYDSKGGCAEPVGAEFARLERGRDNQYVLREGEEPGEKRQRIRGDGVVNKLLAESFIANYTNKLLYSEGQDGWREFTPQGWSEASSGAFNRALAEWIDVQKLGPIPEGPSGDPRRWRHIEVMVKALASTLRCDASDFDKASVHRLRLMFQDGLWEAGVPGVRPLEPAMRWTAAAAIPAMAPAGPPVGLFRTLVLDWMEGSSEQTDALLDALASFMSGTRPHKYLALYGLGRNGKSLLMELLTEAFGPGVVKSISANNARPDKPNYALASVGSARILYLKEARGVDSATFREWTGERTLSVRQIRAEETTIEPKFGLVVAMNEPMKLTPKAADMDRIRVAEFAKTFSDDPAFSDGRLKNQAMLTDVRAELMARMGRNKGAFPSTWPESWTEEAQSWTQSENIVYVETAKKLFTVEKGLTMLPGEAAAAMQQQHPRFKAEELRELLASLLGREASIRKNVYQGIGLKSTTATRIAHLKRPN